MKLWKAKSICTLGIVASLMATAGVNVNNGNFYVSYTDMIVFTPGIPIEFTRTYNSRSSFFSGKFGVGWSSEFDSYIKFDNKDILYFESGGGNVLRFAAKNDSLWVNSQLGSQSIKKIISGASKLVEYALDSGVGKTYTFSNLGQLMKIADGNKNYIELTYEKGTLVKIKDNFNNQIAVSSEDKANFPRITKLKYGDKKATFEYAKTGDLLNAVMMDGNKFVYAYDDEHNLTKIAYGNGTTKTMEYNKVRDVITAFKDIDGSSIKYDYFSDTLDPENKFGTIVMRKDSTGKEDVARFWYEFRKRKDSTRYAYRTVSSYDTDSTETLLTECCGTPLTITQWKLPAKLSGGDKGLAWTQPSGKRDITRFEYYADGNLKKKTLPNGVSLALTYDPKTKKISTLDKMTGKVEYFYDSHENLASAKDYGDKTKLDFTYDLQGRITIVKESSLAKANSARSLFFKYSPEGLPVEVKERNTNGKVALIRMNYFPNGQIKEVLNAQGRDLASQSDISATQRIYSTFQRVLEIIQPTGVSLNAEGAI